MKLLPAIAREAFAEKPNVPLPIWASKHVLLDRRVTTRPGYYDPEEFAWTWEFQEIIRTREVHEATAADGAICIVDPTTTTPLPQPVRQLTVMKASVGGFTEGALNAVRFAAVHDPQNVMFVIDSRVEAGNINEIRLQPTLRRLGQKIFTDDQDDASKFLLKLRRMLIYFFGSYSAGSFANKMCELAIADELEEQGSTVGDTSNVENIRSRIKSAARGLLVLISKPKMAGGPIDAEHKKGSQHVAEVPCPHCGVHQELLQDNMVFAHCKNVLEEWDFERVARETYFRCLHCQRPIEEKSKRWMNDRKNRRWRRTNTNAEPGHISFQLSDFHSYLITWGELAIRYIRSKGDPVARQGYRNHHEGLAYEIRETRTEVADILQLRGPYKRGIIPWKPHALILAADVGLGYVKWSITAFRRHAQHGDGEAAIIDWGKDLHPDDIAARVMRQRYPCAETGEQYGVSIGFMDAKYRKIEVHKACLRVPRRLYPSAGINADLSIRSVSFNKVPQRPRWFGILVYIDRDAKHELYTERIGAWVNWKSCNEDPANKPFTARIWFPEDSQATPDGKEFVDEHTREHLIELPGAIAAKQYTWKRKGANEGGDCSKVACVGWRFFMLGAANIEEAADEEAAAIAEAVSV